MDSTTDLRGSNGRGRGDVDHALNIVVFGDILPIMLKSEVQRKYLILWEVSLLRVNWTACLTAFHLVPSIPKKRDCGYSRKARENISSW